MVKPTVKAKKSKFKVGDLVTYFAIDEYPELYNTWQGANIGAYMALEFSKPNTMLQVLEVKYIKNSYRFVYKVFDYGLRKIGWLDEYNIKRFSQ